MRAVWTWKNTKVSYKCERSTLKRFCHVEWMNEDELQNKYMKEEWMGQKEDCKRWWVELMRSSKRDKWKLKKIEIIYEAVVTVQMFSGWEQSW